MYLKKVSEEESQDLMAPKMLMIQIYKLEGQEVEVEQLKEADK